MITRQQKYLTTEKGKAAQTRARQNYKSSHSANTPWPVWFQHQYERMLSTLATARTCTQARLDSLDRAQATGRLNGTGQTYEMLHRRLQARMQIWDQAIDALVADAQSHKLS